MSTSPDKHTRSASTGRYSKGNRTATSRSRAQGTIMVIRDGIRPSTSRTGGKPPSGTTSSAALDAEQLGRLFDSR